MLKKKDDERFLQHTIYYDEPRNKKVKRAAKKAGGESQVIRDLIDKHL